MLVHFHIFPYFINLPRLVKNMLPVLYVYLHA